MRAWRRRAAVTRRPRLAATVTVLALFGFGAACRGGAGQDAAARVESVFSRFQSRAAPGLAVLVVRNGETVFERGYGVTDLRTKRAIDGATNFRLASVSKQFTAMAIMLLAHDHKLAYDDRLADVLPGFPAYGRAITIRHLLTHTSGLRDYEDLMPKPAADVPDGERQQITDAGALELLKRERGTTFPPGSRWEYSNSAYCVLAMVVEHASEEPFGTFLRERIFAPLKMTRTVAYQKGWNDVSGRAYGHAQTDTGWKETDQSPTSATLGDGGTYSSLDDLAKWDAALREHTLLGEVEMREALTPAVVQGPAAIGPDGRPVSYGFGWFLNPHHGHDRMWHYGETAGFRTTIQRFPKAGLTVIILANRNDVVPTEYALKVADLFLQ
jgi:CubicO group peptidase (beta-lactamase class C family)